jgi:bacillithiol system protein YtxJ
LIFYLCAYKNLIMSFLKNIFSTSKDENQNKPISNLNWIPLTDLGQLSDIQSNSEKPVLLFKHSTTCSISRMALKNFENEFDLQDKIDIYFLDLLNFRAISNEIATKFGVIHQSPQILVIKNGVSIYDASHDRINAQELEKFLN